MSSQLILARRWAQLFVGLFLYGAAIALMVRAGIGVSPWDVLSQGIALHTGIPFGWVTDIVGALVLLLWLPIRQKPGLGTVANVIIVGPSAQLGLILLPAVDGIAAQVLIFAAGLALLAVATGLYLGARLGPGPRDGLMTGIHARYGWRLWLVRAAIEVVVLAVGWALGGNVGVGTVAFAVLVGPMVAFTIPRLRVPSPRPAPALATGTTAGTARATTTTTA